MSSAASRSRSVSTAGASESTSRLLLFHTYYYFSSSVPVFQIPDRRRDLTQLVTPVDDRCQLSGLHEISQDGQVLLVQLRQNHAELLAHERRQHQGLDR